VDLSVPIETKGYYKEYYYNPINEENGSFQYDGINMSY